jgi:D-alanyl-lipoteichoic acid acyltransferase DltB (MBOAT superfamily)
MTSYKTLRTICKTMDNMGLFTILLMVVIFFAVVGLGWKTFSLGVINGFDRAIDVGVPLVKDLTQQATDYVDHPSLQAQSYFRETAHSPQLGN